MPLPTVKPMISRSPLPATSSTRRRLHHPTMDAREFHRSAFSTKPILPGSRTGTTGGGGNAGGRGDDLGALELGLVLLDALLDVRHDVVGTRPGDETRGARGGSDARGGGDAEGRAREAAGEESGGGEHRSQRVAFGRWRGRRREGWRPPRGRYPPHFSVGEEARRRGRGRRARWGGRVRTRGERTSRRGGPPRWRWSWRPLCLRASEETARACVRSAAPSPRVRWERSKRGRRWMG